MTPRPVRVVAARAATVADVMHADAATLGVTASVAEARGWFAASPSRRLALVADAAGLYVGALTAADAAGIADPDRPAVELARYGTTLAPGAPAADGRAAALQADGRRVPVVDEEGRLVGVLALTADARAFACR